MRLRSVMSQSFASGLLSTITDVYWNGALTYFYLQNFGLNIRYEAIVWIIFSVWSTFDNLFAGVLEDRSANRLGRRLPYLRIFGPLLGLFFCLAYFKPPFIQSQFMLALYFLMSLFLLDTCVAFLETALFAIPYEETLSDKGRARVFVWQAFFMLLSILVSVALIPSIQPDPGADLARFRLIIGALGTIAGLGIYASTFLIDSSYRGDVKKGRAVPKLQYCLECLKNRAFLVSEIFKASCVVAYTIFIFGLYYYFDEICVNPVPCYVGAFAGIGIGFLIYFFGSRFQTQSLVVFSCFLGGGLILTGFLVGGRIWGAAIAFIGCGSMYVAEVIYSGLMLGDSIDADEVKSGIRREGTYNGFNCIFSTISNAAQPLFLAIILAYGYVEHQAYGTQTLSAQHGIMVGWLVPPAVIVLLAGLLVWLLYPLKKETIDANRRILDEQKKSRNQERREAL